MRWLLWLSVVCAVGILTALAVKLVVIDPAAENVGMQFTRTVHDSAMVEELAASPSAIFAAGPLLRPADQRQEFIEFTSDLHPRASVWVDRNYVYSFEQQDDLSFKFLDNGCLLPGGGGGLCSAVNELDADGLREVDGTRELELDLHELLSDDRGFWALRYPVIDCADEDTSPTNCAREVEGVPIDSFMDCEVVRVEDNRVVASWSALASLPDTDPRPERFGAMRDPYHCNSIDIIDSPEGDRALVSMRHTDAIYEIDMTTGAVIWKLGGQHWEGVSLTLVNPEALGDLVPGEELLGGQHDARYWSDGLYSVFDNGSLLERPARAFTFTVDERARTATVRTLFEDPAAEPSTCTGSFAAFDNARYWVAGWGCSVSGVTVFNDEGTPIVSTSLDSSARRNLELTDRVFGELRWTLSYRVTPGEPAPFLIPRS